MKKFICAMFMIASLLVANVALAGGGAGSRAAVNRGGNKNVAVAKNNGGRSLKVQRQGARNNFNLEVNRNGLNRNRNLNINRNFNSVNRNFSINRGFGGFNNFSFGFNTFGLNSFGSATVVDNFGNVHSLRRSGNIVLDTNLTTGFTVARPAF